jgi:hypothetical protein
VLHKFLNQSLHIGNIVVWPELDGQPAECLTGHSLHDVEAILDAHYLGRDAKLAEIAIMKLETRTKL